MGLLLLEVGFYVFEETVVVVIRLQVADQFIHVCFSGRRKESILFTDASPDILVCGTEIRVEDSESKIEDSEQEGHEDFVWQMRIQGEAQRTKTDTGCEEERVGHLSELEPPVFGFHFSQEGEVDVPFA